MHFRKKGKKEETKLRRERRREDKGMRENQRVV
jgi:hypothetical protein